MSSFDRTLRRLSAAALLALLTAGCFQPLHGTATVTDTGSSVSNVRLQLSSIHVAEPANRLAQKIREELVFGLTGGSGPGEPVYRLNYQTSRSIQSAVVDPFTNRPSTESVTLVTTYSLMLADRRVLQGRAFAQASYERSRQRFAGLRAQEDAEDRAAKLIAEQVLARLAAHFATQR